MMPNDIVEQLIQERIINHIDNFKSFQFNAGAGAGKTHALVETLKYVTLNKITPIKTSQKVACITYTNVAANEIKNRLGNSDAVHTSTIHEMLWSIIKDFQEQLLILHKEKIEASIHEIKNILLNDEKSSFYTKLQLNEKAEFIEFIEKTRDIFYTSINLNATDFYSTYRNSLNDQAEIIDRYLKRNTTKFKFVANSIYKLQRLEECLKKINSGKEKNIQYDSKVNTDRLHHMKFSHDTLLEYSLKLVTNYPALRRIIIDCYPYIFIDEYQDTHENVINTMKIIHDYSVQKKKNWMIGYFGDSAQNIYPDGVGNKLLNIHPNISSIKKEFNRRSHRQIINIANKIRNDGIIQKPFHEERNDGMVSFYYKATEDKEATVIDFISKYKQELNNQKESNSTNGEETNIHCLVLTNKLMASFNGFSDVYTAFSKSNIYFDNLNTQVLSQQLVKLHPVILTIYHLVKLYKDISENTVSYHDIFGEYSKNITFSSASKVILYLQSNTAISFENWIDLLSKNLDDNNVNETLTKALINRVGLEVKHCISSRGFKSAILDKINTLMNDDVEDDELSSQKSNLILNLPITSLINWVAFIDRTNEKDICYHTYHGTKGEEYLNVAIILEHDFGKRNENKFKNYFSMTEKIKNGFNFSSLSESERNEFTNTKNLIYVACSRAIKNLWVLYLDDIHDIEVGVQNIFGQAIPFDNYQASGLDGNNQPKITPHNCSLS